MGFSFRKRINLGGGFRLNISKRGLGISGGVKGVRLGLGSRGVRLSAGKGPLRYEKQVSLVGSSSQPRHQTGDSRTHTICRYLPIEHGAVYINGKRCWLKHISSVSEVRRGKTPVGLAWLCASGMTIAILGLAPSGLLPGPPYFGFLMVALWCVLFAGIIAYALEHRAFVFLVTSQSGDTVLVSGSREDEIRAAQWELVEACKAASEAS